MKTEEKESLKINTEATEGKPQSNSDDCLENYYAGDAAWKKMAELCKGIKTRNTKELLNLLDNDINLVNVIEARVGESSLFWIKRKIPALNNLRPVDCINNDTLLKRLKECLLRMH
jgi:hypothetical protein